MDPCEKQDLLNELIRPFGFVYDSCKDIFFSAEDAWQHEFGYRTLFDHAAPRFNMVFDCEPVYFNYNDRTWLIEFWKGQYGINTGAEIGIYCAKNLLTPEQYPYAQFDSVPENQMLPMSLKLKYQGKPLFQIQQLHWWLTGFRMGMFTHPKDLEMCISIVFPTCAMMQSFINSLLALGYTSCNYYIYDTVVSLTFSTPHTRRQGVLHSFRSRLAQWKNNLFVHLFYRITRPFACTADRLLYLYYFLPFVFRRTAAIRCPSRKKSRILKKRFRSQKRQRRKNTKHCRTGGYKA